MRKNLKIVRNNRSRATLERFGVPRYRKKDKTAQASSLLAQEPRPEGSGDATCGVSGSIVRVYGFEVAVVVEVVNAWLGNI